MRAGREVRVVFDAGPLAALLASGDDAPLLPTLSYGEARVVYSRGIWEEVRRRLAEAALGGEEVAACLAALRRQGLELEPGSEVEAYEDGGRDEGLRLAVAAGAEVYVTADAGLLELGEWKGIKIVGDMQAVRQLLLSPEETAVAFRAASEPEALRVAEALAAAGIDARVVSQQVPWYDGVLVIGQGYWGEIMVFAKDQAAAARVIEDIEL